MTCVIEEFRPMVRNTLRGFARVRFASGLVLNEIAIHVGGDDGRTWASPPARPMIDRDGVVMRDQRTGNVRYQSDRIIRALRDRYPDALATSAPDRAA